MIRIARRLIQDQGITAARTRDIARACGLSETAPLYYFGTKGRLLAEVLRVQHTERLQVLRARLQPASTRDELVDALHSVLSAFLDERRLRGAHELIAEITRLALEDHQLDELRGQFRQEYRDVLARLSGTAAREGHHAADARDRCGRPDDLACAGLAVESPPTGLAASGDDRAGPASLIAAVLLPPSASRELKHTARVTGRTARGPPRPGQDRRDVPAPAEGILEAEAEDHPPSASATAQLATGSVGRGAGCRRWCRSGPGRTCAPG